MRVFAPGKLVVIDVLVSDVAVEGEQDVGFCHFNSWEDRRRYKIEEERSRFRA